MKLIFGGDIGTASVSFVAVNVATEEGEKSSINYMPGPRIVPISADETSNFNIGKSKTANSERGIYRSTRRRIQRFKQRRENLINILKENRFIKEDTILCENGLQTKHQTLRLRAKAVTEEISLEDLSKVLLLINKKRGYKSNRKIKGDKEEGTLVDGIEIAKHLHKHHLTPGQYAYNIIEKGKNFAGDFYCSDLQDELHRIWDCQRQFYPSLSMEHADLLKKVEGKKAKETYAILCSAFKWKSIKVEWNDDTAQTETYNEELDLTEVKRKKNASKKSERYRLRVKGLTEKLLLTELADVIMHINGQISSSSAYLGKLSDRSKQLVFNNLTIGQYLCNVLDQNGMNSLKNLVFYRQDYMDEFNRIWDTQKKFHPEMTDDLRNKIFNEIIFYQRGLKSKKNLVSFCEFEKKEITTVIDGKEVKRTAGSRVIAKSHPLFQSFKIWQQLNNVKVVLSDDVHVRDMAVKMQSLMGDECDSIWISGSRKLTHEEKTILFQELSLKPCLTKTQVLKLVFPKLTKYLDLNYKELEGNTTAYNIYICISNILEALGYSVIDFKNESSCAIKDRVKKIFDKMNWNTAILDFDDSLNAKDMESNAQFKLWHLLYSYEGDNSRTGTEKLVGHIAKLCNMDDSEFDMAILLTKCIMQDGYGNLSLKAINRILPYLKEGDTYDVACDKAGYRFSASSLTREENENRILKDCLELIPYGSLRSPIVEKILNQMIHCVNQMMEKCGRPDEIHIELARELKKSAKQRGKMTSAINKQKKENKELADDIYKLTGLQHISKNDVLRLRLWNELAPNGYKTLYSNKEIPLEQLFSKDIDIEHIIPKAKRLDSSFSNLTLEFRDVNLQKGSMTAMDYICAHPELYNEEEYIKRCQATIKNCPAKLRNLKMKSEDIPDGFINRDLCLTQYITKKAVEILQQITPNVIVTTGAITDILRKDWQLENLMKELNMPKYARMGMVTECKDRNGKTHYHIENWTKRNDHRHHSIDALIVAFTHPALIQYYNNMNAANDNQSVLYQIKQRYFKGGHAKPPIPLPEFRQQVKLNLENELISFKAKNHTVTNSTNRIKSRSGIIRQHTKTPRGPLHNQTIYGRIRMIKPVMIKIGSAMTKEMAMTVTKEKYRNALLQRLEEYGNNPQKAFSGKNAISKNPIMLLDGSGYVPEQVKCLKEEIGFRVYKTLDKITDFNKILDPVAKAAILQRKEEGGKNAFENINAEPVWYNKEKGIPIKRVAVFEPGSLEPLRYKHDHLGNILPDSNGKPIPCDYIYPGTNHHAAVYLHKETDASGKTKENIEVRIVSFREVIQREQLGLPAVDKDYNKSKGWDFLFSMKKNEYFIIPTSDFNPRGIDLLDPENKAIISPHLFRVQSISDKDYKFRHHLETTINNDIRLKGLIFERIQINNKLKDFVKVRISHIGEIIGVGEY